VTEEPGALDPKTIDELLDSVGGDRAFLAELVDEFLADAPRQLESLRSAIASGDSETARRAAHTLKSTARTFGALALASACQDAEAAAAAGELGTVGAHVDELAALLDRACSALTAVRDANA
jgi:HPt (histidine-containing phosphotransfer) domain-containing protein